MNPRQQVIDEIAGHLDKVPLTARQKETVKAAFRWAIRQMNEAVVTAEDPNPWRWYHGVSEDAERWYGATLTREEAIAEGGSNYDGSAFAIVEARFAEPRAPALNLDSFFIDFGERNEDCWGEDGFEGLRGDREEIAAAEAELETAVESTVAAWLKKHRKLIPVWSLEFQRNHETIAAGAGQ
jgi:hypothetical protein